MKPATSHCRGPGWLHGQSAAADRVAPVPQVQKTSVQPPSFMASPNPQAMTITNTMAPRTPSAIGNSMGPSPGRILTMFRAPTHP